MVRYNIITAVIIMIHHHHNHQYNQKPKHCFRKFLIFIILIFVLVLCSLVSTILEKVKELKNCKKQVKAGVRLTVYFRYILKFLFCSFIKRSILYIIMPFFTYFFIFFTFFALTNFPLNMLIL